MPKIFLSTYLLFAFSLISLELKSQDDTLANSIILENLPPSPIPKNALFIEVFTNGGLYSLNYDRILLSYSKIKFTGRFGLFVMPKSQGLWEGAVVIEPNFLLGSEKFFFEGGLGFTRFHIYEKLTNNDSYKRSDWENYFSFRLGFRFQHKKNNGIFFRAALTPIFYYMDAQGNGWFGQILGGVGVGLSF